MVEENLIPATDAIRRVSVKQLDLAMLNVIAPSFTKQANFKGIGACSGVVSGKPVFTIEDALNCKEDCILIRHETTPDDIKGMIAAVGVVTLTGGETSHAAVVARAMNKPCITGLGIEMEAFSDADVVSMDGATGRVWLEAVPVVKGDDNAALIEAFHHLVCRVHGVVPVITSEPIAKLDAALLYLGDNVLFPMKAAALVKTCLKKVKTLYLDMTPAKDTAEAEFMKMFAGANPEAQVLKVLAALAEDYTNLIVVGATVPHSFATVSVVTDLPSLVLASKSMTLQGIDVTDPAVKKVLSWKAAEGVEAISIGAYAPGTKSIISAQVVLQGVV
jgi:phosphohistidine swiveling domain-containing protein